MNPIVLCACDKIHLLEWLDGQRVLRCREAPRDGGMWLTNTRHFRLENLPVPRPEHVW